MAKKPACFIIPPLALFRTCLCVKTPIRLDSELIIEDNYRFSNWSCVLRKKNSPRHLEDPDREMDISARQLSKFDTFRILFGGSDLQSDFYISERKKNGRRLLATVAETGSLKKHFGIVSGTYLTNK